MGVESNWQRALAQQLAQWQRRRPANDRGEARRGTAMIMLAAAAALGLVAIWLARSVAPAGSGPALRTVPVVVAAVDIGFGETLTPEKLKRSEGPAQGLPRGTFDSIDALITPVPRAALRAIAAGEIILPGALASGPTRLSTAPLLGPDQRAMAVPVDDVSGVTGLIMPGDTVDVLMTRRPDDAMPHAELVAQNVRVLAVGSDMNIGKDKPEAVKAVTLAVSALQAQKLTLAIATSALSLALRHHGDTDRIRLETLQVSDLNDGTVTRLVRKPTASSGGDAPAAPARPGPAAPPGVIVMRGGKATTEPVLP